MGISRKEILSVALLSFILAIWLRFLLTFIGINLSINLKTLPVTTTQMDFTDLISQDKKDPWYYIAGPFHRFDALWYQAVADNNYVDMPRATAFFPLYPWVMKSLSVLSNQPFFIIAYFLNTFLTFTAILFLYLLVRLDYPQNIARRTVFIFALFPSIFYCLSGYAEPLFFSLFFLSLIMAKRRLLLLSAICGMLTAMTKPYGFLVAIPLLGILLSERNDKKRFLKFVPLILIPLGTAAVFLFQKMMLSGSVYISSYPTWRSLIYPTVHLVKAIIFVFRAPFDIANDLNTLVAIGIVAFLVSQFKKIGMFEWLFVLAFLLIMLSLEAKWLPLISFSRHALLLYTVFIYLAQKKFTDIISFLYLGSCGILMTYLFIAFSLGFFVG